MKQLFQLTIDGRSEPIAGYNTRWVAIPINALTALGVFDVRPGDTFKVEYERTFVYQVKRRDTKRSKVWVEEVSCN